MLNKKAHRVAFATGILLVLSLVVFGSLIAVASMSMNNTMAVTTDACSVEETTALACRIDLDLVRIPKFYRLDPSVFMVLKLDLGEISPFNYKYRIDLIELYPS